MLLLALEPESSVSTNSTTSALSINVENSELGIKGYGCGQIRGGLAGANSLI